MKVARTALTVAVALSPLGSASLLAQNNTCASPAALSVDTGNTSLYQEATADAERWYFFITFARRSYCTEALASSTENNPLSTRLEHYLENPFNCAAAPLLAANDFADGEPWMNGSRICFVGLGEARVVRVRPATGSAPAPRAITVRLTETTLFSPYWQVVTAAGYDAAPQIRNNTHGPVNVSLTAYDSAGTPTGCVDAAFLIPANGMVTFGISGLCGITSGFGSMSIAHDGPPGAIGANITTFSALSGLSFDAAFDVRQKNVPIH